MANELELRFPTGDASTDPQIARAAVNAIRSELPAVSDQIKVLVHHGLVTLEGNVEWNFLKERAGTVVGRLKGVVGITNAIVIQPRVRPMEINKRIENAFRRSAQVDANQITVEAHGGEVTLRGGLVGRASGCATDRVVRTRSHES